MRGLWLDVQSFLKQEQSIDKTFSTIAELFRFSHLCGVISK